MHPRRQRGPRENVAGYTRLGPLIIPHRVGGGYTRPYTVFRRRVGLG